jgi:hypothetical protein
VFVVGCRVPVVGCRVLTSSRVSLTLVVVLVPGFRLSVNSCWLLIFCAGCRAVLLLSVPSSVCNCGEQYTVSQTTFFRY